MILKITGDTHGEKSRILDYKDAHKKYKDFDALLVCGDFGFLWYNSQQEKDFLDRIEKECDFDILFVDGNHENFPLIYSFPVEDWNGGKIHRIRKNIIHLMRGEVYTINDKKFFVFGSGYSIDKARRIEGKSWWVEELPSFQEIQNAQRNLGVNNWKVDYVFTHSAPTNVLPLISEFFISPHKVNIDIANSTLEDIRQKLEFNHWFIGHYHGEKNIDNKFTLLYHTSRNLEI